MIHSFSSKHKTAVENNNKIRKKWKKSIHFVPIELPKNSSGNFNYLSIFIYNNNIVDIFASDFHIFQFILFIFAFTFIEHEKKIIPKCNHFTAMQINAWDIVDQYDENLSHAKIEFLKLNNNIFAVFKRKGK